MQSRKLNSSTVLNLWPKKPSLGDPETVTLAVLLTSTAGDLGNPSGRVSRTNPCCPQHLPGQGSETGEELQLMPHGIQHTGQSRETDGRKLCFPAKVLKAQLKDQLHEAKSVVTGKNAVSPLPAPAVRKDEGQKAPAAEGEATAGWQLKQQGSGLAQAALNPWAAAGRLNAPDNTSVFRHHKTSAAPSPRPLLRPPAQTPHLPGSVKGQNDSDAEEQTGKPPGVEARGGAEQAPSPRQDYAWASTKHRQGSSAAPNESSAKRLFHKAFGDVDAQEEPAPREREAEQGLNPNQHFVYDLLVANNPPAATSALKDTAKEEGSSRGGHLPARPQTTDTHRRLRREGPVFLHKRRSSDGPDSASVRGDLFETRLRDHLRSLISDEALRTFVARVARAPRTDCSLPECRARTYL